MSAESPKARNLTIELEHDDDVEDPQSEDGRWKIYSFCTRHSNFKHPDNFINPPLAKTSIKGKKGKITATCNEVQRKLKVGLAFLLSYFEHGQCQWMLKDTDAIVKHSGDWRWDGVDVAGIMVWEEDEDNLGPKTFDERKEDAAREIETYTDWCNGVCYRFTITDDDTGEEIASEGHCIGEDHLTSAVHEHTTTEDNVTVTGESAWVADYHSMTPKKKEAVPQ